MSTCSSAARSISGDEQERERINLERNLLAFDDRAQPSFYDHQEEEEAYSMDDRDHLAQPQVQYRGHHHAGDDVTEEEEEEEYASIEQARRRQDSSRDISLSRIRSLRGAGALGDDLGLGQDSEIRAWSYRSDFSMDEDDEGVDPYPPTQPPARRPASRQQHHHTQADPSLRESPSGYTAMTDSTAQHHASALTMNAGLGGRATARRRRGVEKGDQTATNASMSGAEYDPDRPIYDMLARVGQDWEKGMRTYDPVVVDDTADLNAVLGDVASTPTRRELRRASSPAPSHSSASSAGRPQSNTLHLPANRRLTASAGARLPSASVSQPPPTRASKTRQQYHPSQYDYDLPTPKQHRVSFSSGPSPSNARPSGPTPSQRPAAKRVHATPPSVRSEQPTGSAVKRRAARRKDDYAAAYASPLRGGLPPEPQYNHYPSHYLSPARPPINTKLVYEYASPAHGRSVHLPDFTGITQAVESPAPVRVMVNNAGHMKKAAGGAAGSAYKQYVQPPSHSQKESAILSSLSSIRKRLMKLEEENGTTRHRINELEDELRRVKNRSMRQDASFDDREERHALETLVKSLHSHLERLSLEMKEQGKVLSMLLSIVRPSGAEGQTSEQAEALLRDQAQKAAMEQEAEKVRSQVERLAGEVEALREVVEEGLRGRDTTDDEEEMETTDVEEEQEEEDVVVDEEDEEDEAPVVTPTSEELPRHQSDLSAANPRAPSPSLKPSKRPATQFRMTLRSPDASVSRSLTEEFERCKLRDSSHSALSFNPDTGSNTSSRGGIMRTSTPPPPSSHRSVSSTTPSADPPSLLIAQSQNQPHSRAHYPPLEDPFPRLQGTKRRREKRSTTPPGPVNSPPKSHQHLDDLSEQRRMSDQESEASSGYIRRRRHAERTNVPPQHVEDPEESLRSHQHHHHQTRDSAVPGPQPRMRTARLEKMFVEAPEHDEARCTACRRMGTAVPVDLQSRREQRERVAARKCSGAHESAQETQDDVVKRILKELEDDFAHYKSIYVNISSQYEQLDAISNVPQRNALARHLHDVIDILEQKGDQIASLSDMINNAGSRKDATADLARAGLAPLGVGQVGR